MAKWFAVLGTAVQCSLFVGIGFFVAGMLRTFQEITAAGTSDPRLMAEGVGQALVPVVLALGIGTWGVLISLVTANVSSYRSRWFFWFSAISAVAYAALCATIYMVVLPAGTALGLVFVIFLVAKRHEFRSKAQDANGNAGA
jgi:hypothetical protein